MLVKLSWSVRSLFFRLVYVMDKSFVRGLAVVYICYVAFVLKCTSC